jgi:hypothetical protein
VAKVPIKKVPLVHFLEDNGFRFMESQVDIYKKLSDGWTLSGPIRKFIDQTTVSRIESREQLDSVLNEIGEGMFDTDRISLDPCFNLDIASTRYRNWICDEFVREGTELYELIYDGSRAGFFAMKGMDSSKPYLMLGGVYNKYKGMGLGACIIERQLYICSGRGKKAVVTKISSNNVDILKIYSMFGFATTNISHVFRRMNKDV